MKSRYRPSSKFLISIIDGDISLDGSEFSEINMSRLIELTSDKDESNRDWATMLLSQQEADTPAVRSALLRAAVDENAAVRAEAILGLSERDPDLAYRFVKSELSKDAVGEQVFVAAAHCAHPSLLEDLEQFVDENSDELIQKYIKNAIEACKMAK